MNLAGLVDFWLFWLGDAGKGPDLDFSVFLDEDTFEIPLSESLSFPPLDAAFDMSTSTLRGAILGWPDELKHMDTSLNLPPY